MAESNADKYNADSNQDAKEIIDGILADAREEAEKIRSEAKSRVEDRRMLLSGRVQRVKDDAVSEAKKRIEEINRRTDAEISRAQRRNELARRRDVLAAVQQRARERIVEMSREGSDAYRQAMIGWIAEGAIGLEGTELTVSVAAGETELLRDLLEEAQRTAREVGGRDVTLTAAAEPHAGSPGVVVSSPDGRTLYDNRVDSRIRRHETEIRRLVYEILFTDGDGGSTGGGTADGDGAESGDGG
ncbi:MAG: V-type ATP synthase subunit E family protein [Spirochaetia bacterium]